MSRGGGGGGARKPTGVSVLASHLGIQRGDITTQAVSQPPPLFPSLDCKPLPLTKSEDHSYMVALRHEFTNRMRESPYFLKDREPKKDVERYSDKYRKAGIETWIPYFSRLPKELWPKHLLTDSKASNSRSAKRRKIDARADSSFAKKFETLEKREKEGGNATKDDADPDSTKKKKGDDDEDEEKEANDDEQEMSDDDYREEDNDYIQNYFDNGDNYLEDSEENLEDEAFY